MKKVLFSTFINTHTQKRICNGLIKLLEKNNFAVDVWTNVPLEEGLSYKEVRENINGDYDLIIAFNKKGYDRIEQFHSYVPVIYSVAVEDYVTEYIYDTSKYKHVLLATAGRSLFTNKFATQINFPYVAEDLELKKRVNTNTIAIGVNNGQVLLRVILLLNTMPDYKATIFTTIENDFYKLARPNITICRDIELKDEMMQDAAIIIGDEYDALRGISLYKPVIVAGRYGYGGLLNRKSVIDQYITGFKGKIGGGTEEYFPLELMRADIAKAHELPDEELKEIFYRMQKEAHKNENSFLSIVSSFMEQ